MESLDLLLFADASFPQPFEERRNLDFGDTSLPEFDGIYDSGTLNKSHAETIALWGTNSSAINPLAAPPFMPNSKGNFLRSVHLLRKSFHKNDIPSENEILQLVNTTGLEEYEISTWFDGERSERTKCISGNLLPTPYPTQHLKSPNPEVRWSSMTDSCSEYLRLPISTSAIHSQDGTITTHDRLQTTENFSMSIPSSASNLNQPRKRKPPERTLKDGKKTRLSGQPKKELPTSLIEQDGDHPNLGELGCPSCRRSSETKADWFFHQERKHFPKFIYLCRGIGSGGRPCATNPFKRRDNFRDHLKKSHPFDSSPALEAKIVEGCVEIQNLFHEICGFCKANLADREESLLHIWKHIQGGAKVADWEHFCSSQHIITLHIHYELPWESSAYRTGSNDEDDGNDDGPDFGGTGDSNGDGNGDESSGYGAGNDFHDGGPNGSFGDNFRDSGSKHNPKDYGPASDSNQTQSFSSFSRSDTTPTVESLEDLSPQMGFGLPLEFSQGNHASGSFDIVACPRDIAPKAVQYIRKRKGRLSTLSALKSDVGALKVIEFPHLVQFMDSSAFLESYSMLTLSRADGNLTSYLRRQDFLLEIKPPLSPDVKTPGHLLWDSIGSLAAAVSYLHSQNIIHGDLRPENVLIKGHNMSLSGFKTAVFSRSYGTVKVVPLNSEISVQEFREQNINGQSDDVWGLGYILTSIMIRCIGGTLDDLDSFRLGTSPMRPFSESSRRTRECLAGLKEYYFEDHRMSNRASIMLFDTILHMVDENRDARPSADESYLFLSNRSTFHPGLHARNTRLGIANATIVGTQNLGTGGLNSKALLSIMSTGQSNESVDASVSNFRHTQNEMNDPMSLFVAPNGPSRDDRQPPLYSIQLTREINKEILEKLQGNEVRSIHHGQLVNTSRPQSKRRRERDGNILYDGHIQKRSRNEAIEPLPVNSRRKFACPFRKHNPLKYNISNWRSCALGAYSGIAQLSEHLVMKHLIFQCERCMEVFQDQVTLNNHFRSLRSCELAPATCQDDGITKATMEKLKSKKKRYLNKAADHRWKEMFLLLFPDADVPSPYFEPIPEDSTMNGYNGSKVLGDFVVPYIFETPRTCGKMLQDTALLNAPIEESLHWQLVSPQKAQDEGSQGFQEQCDGLGSIASVMSSISWEIATAASSLDSHDLEQLFTSATGDKALGGERDNRQYEWACRIPSCNNTGAIYNEKGSWVPTTCLWEGCATQTLFKTRRHWLSHVNVNHQKAFCCDTQGCEVRRGAPGERAFGTKSDLLRHELTHKSPELCAKPDCPGRRGANLSRADKRAAHELRWHGPLECHVPGCRRRRINGIDYGFSSAEDLDHHSSTKHPSVPPQKQTMPTNSLLNQISTDFAYGPNDSGSIAETVCDPITSTVEMFPHLPRRATEVLESATSGYEASEFGSSVYKIASLNKMITDLSPQPSSPAPMLLDKPQLHSQSEEQPLYVGWDKTDTSLLGTAMDFNWSWENQALKYEN